MSSEATDPADAEEITMLRGEIARCRQRGQLLALSLDIARKQALKDAAEIERLQVPAGILRKIAIANGGGIGAGGYIDCDLDERDYTVAEIAYLDAQINALAAAATDGTEAPK